MTPRRRTGVTARGRAIAVTLAVFLAVAVGVVWRRTKGTATARQLETLAHTRSELESKRLQLESDIVALTGLSRLAPRVQGQMGLHVPNDSQIVLLPRPKRREGR